MSRCNFDGWSDVIGEVPWCLSMQTTVRHEAELESDPMAVRLPGSTVIADLCTVYNNSRLKATTSIQIYFLLGDK